MAIMNKLKIMKLQHLTYSKWIGSHFTQPEIEYSAYSAGYSIMLFMGHAVV